jgi:hypothetical protein
MVRSRRTSSLSSPLAHQHVRSANSTRQRVSQNTMSATMQSFPARKSDINCVYTGLSVIRGERRIGESSSTPSIKSGATSPRTLRASLRIRVDFPDPGRPAMAVRVVIFCGVTLSVGRESEADEVPHHLVVI